MNFESHLKKEACLQKIDYWNDVLKARRGSAAVDLGLDWGLAAQADQTYDNVDPWRLHAALSVILDLLKPGSELGGVITFGWTSLSRSTVHYCFETVIMVWEVHDGLE